MNETGFPYTLIVQTNASSGVRFFMPIFLYGGSEHVELREFQKESFERVFGLHA